MQYNPATETEIETEKKMTNENSHPHDMTKKTTVGLYVRGKNQHLINTKVVVLQTTGDQKVKKKTNLSLIKSAGPERSEPEAC